VSVGKTINSVALHLDDRGHLRHLFYRDVDSSFGQKVTCFEEDSEDDKEDLCEKKAVQNTIDFWNKVWSCHNIWGVPARASILQDVIVQLEHLLASPCSYPLIKCLKTSKIASVIHTLSFLNF